MTLAEQYQSGRTLRELAAEACLSDATIRRRLLEAGITRRRPGPIPGKKRRVFQCRECGGPIERNRYYRNKPCPVCVKQIAAAEWAAVENKVVSMYQCALSIPMIKRLTATGQATVYEILRAHSIPITPRGHYDRSPEARKKRQELRASLGLTR